MSLPEIKDILFVADGITDTPMETEDDVEALREQNKQLQVRVDELWIERWKLWDEKGTRAILIAEPNWFRRQQVANG